MAALQCVFIVMKECMLCIHKAITVESGFAYRHYISSLYVVSYFFQEDEKMMITERVIYPWIKTPKLLLLLSILYMM